MNWCVPTFHPAHIMRKNRKLEGLLLKDLRRAVGLAQGDWKPKWNEQGDGYKLRPSADDVVRILDSMHGHDVAYDIETDGQHPLLCTIRCIGFWDGKVGVCVPWLFRDGTTEEVVDRDKKGKVRRTKKGAVKIKTVAVWKPYFKGEALKRVDDAIQRLFKRAKSLVSQNGQYDRLCLKVRMGFDIPCALPPNFDCHLEAETEFLTQRGWKRYDDVLETDLIGSFSSNGAFEWQRPTKRVSYPYTGVVYDVETHGTRCVVSPNHRMWVRPRRRTAKGYSGVGEWQFRRVDELERVGEFYDVLTATSGVQEKPTPPGWGHGFATDEDFWRWVGIAISDGTCAGSAVTVSQKLGGVAEKVLRRLKKQFQGASRRPYARTEYWRRKPCVEVLWRFPGLSRWFRQHCGQYSTSRHLPPEFLTLPLRCRRALLEGLLLGDGTQTKTYSLHRTYSARLANEVQALAVSIGEHEVSPVFPMGESFCVRMLPRLTRTIRARDREGPSKGNITKRFVAEERLVCFAVPNETLVTRSHGKVAFHGNTIIGHHIVASYMPHGLDLLTSVYTDMPYYKKTEEGEAWSTSSDRELWLYCLRGDVRVVMADGSRQKISDLVRTRSRAKVLSMSPEGKLEARRIAGWHRNRVPEQKWVQISTEADCSDGMTVTPEHKVWVRLRGWIKAKDVQIGDELALPEQRLPHNQLSALMGTLLGDSSLSVSPSFRIYPEYAPSASVRGNHRLDSQLSQEKVRLLGEVATLDPPRKGGSVRIKGRLGVGRRSQPWRTKSLAQLSFLLPYLFDARGKKRLSLAMVQRMGPIGWAWWFMDDGCRQNGQRKKRNTGARGGQEFGRDTITLATQCFTREDIDAVVEWMRDRFGPTSAGRDNVIRMGVRASEAFCREIAPHVFPTQRYKLPREGLWAPYRDFDTKATNEPVYSRVREVKKWKAPRETKAARHRADTRWCLDVEGNHNFFTQYGLVHNCLRDCEATWLSAQKLRAEVKERPQDIALYEHDAWQEHQCQLWKEAGIECDEEAMLLFRQHYRGIAAKALKTMKEVVERALAATKDPNKKLTQANSNLSELLVRLEAKADQEETDDLGKTVELFNPASLIQLRALLIGIGIPLSGETATGQLSTAEEFLLTARKELLAKNVDPKDDRLLFLDCLFAWRAAKKVDSTYLFPELIEHAYIGVNGGKAKRLHSTFAVHVVPSGRLASKKPNFQNQPANIRGMYVARPGHILVYIDWDALEMRLGAFMSGDATFIEDFKKWDARTGPKVHIVNMCAIFGLPLVKGIEDKHPGCYRAAKVFAYAVAYGAGEQTVFEQVRAEMPDMDFPKFKAVYAAYKQFRKRLFEFQASVVRFATQHQHYETAIAGRRAYFFEQVFGSDSPEASAMQNFPYQGTGSDVVGRANRRIVERVLEPMQKALHPGEVLQQLAQVHDELLFEVPLRLEKEFSEKLKKVAEEPPGKEYTSWSLPVDLKSSRRWKPIKWSCQHCDKALKNKVELELFSKTPVLSIWTGKCKTCEKETKVEVVKTPLMDVQPEETPRAEEARAEEDREEVVEQGQEDVVRPKGRATVRRKPKKGGGSREHRARNAG